MCTTFGYTKTKNANAMKSTVDTAPATALYLTSEQANFVKRHQHINQFCRFSLNQGDWAAFEAIKEQGGVITHSYGKTKYYELNDRAVDGLKRQIFQD